MNNARQFQQDLGLEKSGFQLEYHPFPKEINNVYDKNQMEKYYIPSMEQLLKKLYPTGIKFKCVGYKIRPQEDQQAHVVHNDATQEYCQNLHKNIINDYVPQQYREQYSKKRFVWVNIWRPIIDTPVMQGALALCDVNSTNNQEKIVIQLRDRKNGKQDWDLLGLKPSQEHMWYYYPQQVKDECVIFKQYDSQKNQTKFCFHTAFEDPNNPNDTPTRYSIETRCLIWFDEYSENQYELQQQKTMDIESAHPQKYLNLQMYTPCRAKLRCSVQDSKNPQQIVQGEKWAMFFDGRSQVQPSLQSHGVQLVQFQTQVNFQDQNQVKNVFYQECQNVLRRFFPNMKYFLVNNHELPVDKYRFYWAQNGGTVQQFQQWGQRIKRNHIFFSIIKPTCVSPILKQPLAFCDRNFVNPQQDYSQQVHEQFSYNSIKFREIHRWFYFPKLNENEAIIWIRYDSSQQNMASVFKAEFQDPNCPNDAPDQEQILVNGIIIP